MHSRGNRYAHSHKGNDVLVLIIFCVFLGSPAQNSSGQVQAGVLCNWNIKLYI